MKVELRAQKKTIQSKSANIIKVQEFENKEQHEMSSYAFTKQSKQNFSFLNSDIPSKLCSNNASHSTVAEVS